MVNVTVSTNGTSGPRGNGWLSGVGVPSNSLGFDGDYYINTSVPGVFYGPKAAGAWPAAVSFTTGASVFTSTGVISGALVTANNTTSFNVSAGAGVIVDYATTPNSPTFTPVAIAAQTITLTPTELSRSVNWWVADTNGVITSQATRPQHGQRRTALQLGSTEQSAGTIITVTPGPVYVPQGTIQLYDLLYELGPFNSPDSTSNVITPNGANLRINKSVGQVFSPTAGYANGPNNIHYVANPAETPVSFFYATRASGTETPATLIDPTTYDLNGVLTPVNGGTNTSTIQYVFLVPTGSAGNQVVVQYGQTTYSSLSNAVSAIGTGNFITNPDLDGTSTLLYWICTTRVCTSLQDTTNCTIVRAARFALP